MVGIGYSGQSSNLYLRCSYQSVFQAGISKFVKFCDMYLALRELTISLGTLLPNMKGAKIPGNFGLSQD